MRSEKEIMDEYRQEKSLARAIRQGTRPQPNYADPQQMVEGVRQFNEHTRNRALLLAVSKRMRRTYLWGSTLLLFVVSPLLFFSQRLLGSYFEPTAWWLVPILLGAIVVPLCALRGYFIWVRSHWYRWIGKDIKNEYDEGVIL